MAGKLTARDALAQHAIIEQQKRQDGDEEASLFSSMVRAFVPENQTITLPPDHHLIVVESFTIKEGGALVMSAGSKLRVLA